MIRNLLGGIITILVSFGLFIALPIFAMWYNDENIYTYIVLHLPNFLLYIATFCFFVYVAICVFSNKTIFWTNVKEAKDESIEAKKIVK